MIQVCVYDLLSKDNFKTGLNLETRRVRSFDKVIEIAKKWKKTGKPNIIISAKYKGNSIATIPDFKELCGSRCCDYSPDQIAWWTTCYTVDMIRLQDTFCTKPVGCMDLTYQYDHFAKYFADLNSEDKYLYCYIDNQIYRIFADVNIGIREMCLEYSSTESIRNSTFPEFDDGLPFYYYRKAFPEELTDELFKSRGWNKEVV